MAAELNTVKALVDHWAAIQPDKAYLIDPDAGKEMSYEALRGHCLEINAWLEAKGIARGEKVAFLLPNGYWSAALLVGVMYSGRTIVPLNAVSGESALSYVIQHSDSRLLFVDDCFAEKFAAVLASRPDGVELVRTHIADGPDWGSQPQPGPAAETDQSDIAVLMYTSGTTGVPKGVLLSQANAVAGGRNTAIAHELTDQDRALCVLPLYHINGQMVTIMGPLVSGGSVVMPPKFSASNFWELLADHHCRTESATLNP
ncbi:MAG: AMP-binding protein [Gammaproteobacteria bacterium]